MVHVILSDFFLFPLSMVKDRPALPLKMESFGVGKGVRRMAMKT